MDLWNERQCSMDELIPLIQEQLAKGKKVRFSPRGVSMLPMLRQGKDCVELKLLIGSPKKYDILLYRGAQGNYILHRVVSVGNSLSCMGDHQFVKEEGIRQEQIIGVVSGFYRGERYRSIECLDYWLYCRFWYHSRALRHFLLRGGGFLRRTLNKKSRF